MSNKDIKLLQDEVFHFPFVVNDLGPALPMSQTIDWGTNILNIPAIHALGITGSGIKVAVIDTGIDRDHPDLQGGIYEIKNVTGEPFAATHGHGIGAAGIIGARNNNTGILGTAYDCQILGIKGMRESGGGSLTEIIAGIDYAITSMVHIINLSLGTTSNAPAFEAAIKRATAAGIYVVCSAGNAGQDNSVVYPARYEESYAVGATNQAGKVSAFSSRGWEVDIAAPGERVLTTWKNKSYARVSGTSFSAPYVAGLFALFLHAGIKISHKRLKLTAIDIEEPGQDQKSGHGLIDPVKFIQTFKHEEPTPAPVAIDPCAGCNCPDCPDCPQCPELNEIINAHKILGDFLKGQGLV